MILVKNRIPNLTEKDHGRGTETMVQENEDQNRHPGVHTENVGPEPDQNLAVHTEGIVQDHDQNPKVLKEENTGRDQKVLIERKIRKNQVDIIRKSIKIIDIEVHPVIVVTVMLKNINQPTMISWKIKIFHNQNLHLITFT